VDGLAKLGTQGYRHPFYHRKGSHQKLIGAGALERGLLVRGDPNS